MLPDDFNNKYIYNVNFKNIENIKIMNDYLIQNKE
jgi:hypothetical protein